MVKFGKFIESNVKKEWEKNYLDYNKLKDKIKELCKLREKYEKENKVKYYPKKSSEHNKEIDYFKKSEKDKESGNEGGGSSNKSPQSKQTHEKPKETQDIIELKDDNNKQEKKEIPNIISQPSNKQDNLMKKSSINFLRKSSRNLLQNDQNDTYESLLQSHLGVYIDEFISELEFEIKKFSLFFKTLEKKLYRDINQKLQKELSFDNYSFFEIFRELMTFDEQCEFIYDVCNFVNVNVTGVRKILKKFDEKFEMSDNPIALFYLGTALEDPESSLLYILKFKCIDDCSALIEKLVDDLENVVKKKLEVLSNPEIEKKLSDKTNFDIDEALEEPLIQKEIKLEELNLEKAELINIKLTEKILKLKARLETIDEANDIIRTSMENWTLVVQNNLRMINDRDAEFKIWKSQTKAQIANTEIIIKNLAPQLLEKASTEVPQHNLFNIWVCLIHTCVNSLNSTIVFPTNSKYIESIGASGFLTGIVIAATHCAAIGFTFTYSSWTNSSYRKPLVFSIIAYFFGNIFYAFSGYLMSVYPMIIGRFLIGVGSARVINRRYLIDHVEEAHLLYYSMMYVIMTSLGNVLGPLLAVILLLSLGNYRFFNGVFELDEFTWPAWICSVFWIIALLIVYIYFDEPINLKKKQEIKDRQASQISSKNKNIKINDNNLEEEYESINHPKQIEIKDDNQEIKELKTEESKNQAEDTITVEKQNQNLNKENNVSDEAVKSSGKGIGTFVEKDIKEIIHEQETNVFSYMTMAFTILVFTLFLIRVKI